MNETQNNPTQYVINAIIAITYQAYPVVGNCFKINVTTNAAKILPKNP